MTNEKSRICYTCKFCDFISYNKTDYERHLTRRKHDENVKNYEKTLPKPDPNACPFCHKIFKHKTSVYKHKTICGGPSPPPTSTTLPHAISPTTTTTTTTTTTPTEQYLLEVITKNQELTSAMMILIQQNTELQAKMIELCSNNTTNNTTNNNTITTTNSHNPTFNMNLFLNEKCKDAMNMKDFVNSIQLTMTDLENVDRLGYVEGMSSIFIDNLQKTDIYKRPVHCSDVKRETLYVKDDNQWEREGPDHVKMTNAVLAVEQKNVILVNEWAKANPRCLNSNTRENERYFRLSKAATDGEKDGNIDKVIRKVAKRVAIEKEVDGASST